MILILHRFQSSEQRDIDVVERKRERTEAQTQLDGERARDAHVHGVNNIRSRDQRRPPRTAAQ